MGLFFKMSLNFSGTESCFMFAVFALKKSFNNVESGTMKSKIDGFVS